MHSAEALSAADFTYRDEDGARTDGSAMPDVGVPDRIGVVSRRPFDGLGAATFVLACVSAFYDAYRATADDVFAYPDYFTFQSHDRSVDYGWLDVWPAHKHVDAAPTAEATLRAINDRAVTVLLVPDGPTGDPDLEAVTRESFDRRIDRCYRYAPDGRLDDESFSISLPRDPVREWLERTLDSVEDDGDDGGDDRRTQRERAWRDRIEDGTITQEFREVGPGTALRYLPGDG